MSGKKGGIYMANYQLAAKPRTTIGTAAAKRIRRENLVPANVYGREKDNENIVIDIRELEKALSAAGQLIDLNVEDQSRVVIMKEMQRDPIKGTIQHVDFYEVSMDRPIDTTVAIRLDGEADRESDGGIVNQVLRQLDISCLPGVIPNSIHIDVSSLTIGDTILVSDLDIPEGVNVLNDIDEVVVAISAPSMEVEEEEEEEEVLLDEDGEPIEGEGAAEAEEEQDQEDTE